MRGLEDMEADGREEKEKVLQCKGIENVFIGDEASHDE